MVCTFLWGLLAHGFTFFNTNFSHDELTLVYQRGDFDFEISIGRFMQPVYMGLFRGTLLSPWLIGALSLAMLALAVYLIIRMFDVRSTRTILVVSGLLATNMALTLAFATYRASVDIFVCALLFATVSVYLWRRYRYGFLPAILTMTISLGLYSAYATSAVTLVLLCLLVSLWNGEAVRKVVRDGALAVLMLLASGALYLLLSRVVANAAGVTLNDAVNTSITSIGDYAGYSVMQLLRETYLFPFTFVWSRLSMGNWLIRACWILLAATPVGLTAYALRRHNMRPAAAVLAVVIMLLLPLAVNFAYFLSKGFVHERMAFAFFLVPAFAAIAVGLPLFQRRTDTALADAPEADTEPSVEDAPKHAPDRMRWLSMVTACALLVMTFANIRFANDVYLKKDLEAQATLSVMTRVMDRIDSIPDYVPGETPVAIYGMPESLQHKMLGFEPYYDYEGLFATTAVTYNLRPFPN